MRYKKKNLTKSGFHPPPSLQIDEAARINYEEVTKLMKKACKCKTKYCPNWECCCEVDEDTGELEGGCTCRPCGCEDCTSCKVRVMNLIKVSSNVPVDTSKGKRLIFMDTIFFYIVICNVKKKQEILS